MDKQILRYQVINACFKDGEFKETIKSFIQSFDTSDMSDREALSIVRIALNDPDLFDYAVHLHNVDYRDLFMVAGHGELNSHLEWASSVLAKRPQSTLAPSPPITVSPDPRGIVKCPKCGYAVIHSISAKKVASGTAINICAVGKNLRLLNNAANKSLVYPTSAYRPLRPTDQTL